MKPKVYFNLDLTLTRMDTDFQQLVVMTLRRMDAPEDEIEPDLYQELFFERFNDLQENPRGKAFREYFAAREIDRDPRQAAEIYCELELQATKAQTGLQDLLRKISQSTPVGIITAGTIELQRAKIEKLGIGDVLEQILITYGQQMSKAEILQNIGDKRRESPIYISGSESDIEKASGAGWKTLQKTASQVTPSEVKAAL